MFRISFLLSLIVVSTGCGGSGGGAGGQGGTGNNGSSGNNANGSPDSGGPQGNQDAGNGVAGNGNPGSPADAAAGGNPNSPDGAAGAATGSNWPGTRVLREGYIDHVTFPSGTQISISLPGGITRLGADGSYATRRLGLFFEDVDSQVSQLNPFAYEDADGNIIFSAALAEFAGIPVTVSLRPDLSTRWMTPGNLGVGVGTDAEGNLVRARRTSEGWDIATIAANGDSTALGTLSGVTTPSLLKRLPNGNYLVFGRDPDPLLRTFDPEGNELTNCVPPTADLIGWDDAGVVLQGPYPITQYVAIDFDCTEAWTYALPEDAQIRSAPSVLGDMLLIALRVGMDVSFRGISRADGTEQWSAPIGEDDPDDLPSQLGFSLWRMPKPYSVPVLGDGYTVHGGIFTGTTTRIPFLMRVDPSGQELFKWNAATSDLALTEGAVDVAVPDGTGGTLAQVQGLVNGGSGRSFFVRLDENGAIDPGPADAEHLYCYHDTLRVCTEITNIGDSTPEAFSSQCIMDGGMMTADCTAAGDVFLDCDGANYDINGQMVDGRSFVFQGSTWDCAQATNACSISNGVPGTCSPDVLLQPRDFVDIDCGDGTVYEQLDLPAATADCQDALVFFAETFGCNRIDDFDAAIQAFDDCYPPISAN